MKKVSESDKEMALFKHEQIKLIDAIRPKLIEIQEMAIRIVDKNHTTSNAHFVIELLKCGVFQGYMEGLMDGIKSNEAVKKSHDSRTKEEEHLAKLRLLLMPLTRRVQEAVKKGKKTVSPKEDSSS